MLMETLALILCIIIFVVSNIVFMPIEIYYTVGLYKRKDSLIISKRKPSLIVIGVTLATLFFLWNTTYSLITFSKYKTLAHSQWFITIFIPIGMTSWYIYIARLWLIFYQLKFNIETIALKWQSIIDPTNSNKAFYHSYKHLIGTWKAASIILITYELTTISIVIVILSITIDPVSNTTKWLRVEYVLHWIFSFIALYVPLVVLVFIAFKIPEHYDNIGLSKEVKFTSYCFLVIVLTCSVFDILILLFTDKTSAYRWDLLYLSTMILWRIVFFVACMIQTKYPIKVFGPILDRYSTSTAVKLTHKATLEELKTINVNSTAENTATMKQVLSDDQSFDLFVKHCCNEHCLECILSVIELIQYKCKLYEMIINNDNLDIECIEDDREKYLSLPAESVPKSMIVYNEEMDNKLIARELYLKYIKVNSAFEINLSYSDRKKYNRLMENKLHWQNESKYNEIKLYSLYDMVISEMCQLLRAAFSRYIQSNEYIILKRHSI